MDGIDHTAFEQGNQKQLDENLLVKFFTKPRPDSEATAKEGRPVFKEVEYVDIRVPGQKNSVCRPARQSDIERFPRHYAAFKQRLEEPIEGTPLTEWPPISRAVVEQLSFMNVKTVEQLASVSDGDVGQIMGGFGLKKQAQDFLEYSKQLKSAGDIEGLKQENAELKELIKGLSAQVAELQQQDKTEEVEEEAEEEPEQAAEQTSDEVKADGQDEEENASEGDSEEKKDKEPKKRKPVRTKK